MQNSPNRQFAGSRHNLRHEAAATLLANKRNRQRAQVNGLKPKGNSHAILAGIHKNGHGARGGVGTKTPSLHALVANHKFPTGIDSMHTLRTQGEQQLYAFVQMNMCTSMLEMHADRLDTRASFQKTTNIFIADETKLPVYIAAFGSGFFSTIIGLCTLLYVKFIFTKIKRFGRRHRLKRDETSLLLSQKSLVYGAGNKESLAEIRSKNPHLTRIEDYMEKGFRRSWSQKVDNKVDFKPSFVDTIGTQYKKIDDAIPPRDTFKNVFTNFAQDDEDDDDNVEKEDISTSHVQSESQSESSSESSGSESDDSESEDSDGSESESDSSESGNSSSSDSSTDSE
ncbi:hypothetical protein BdWA1_001621 [Babesia duncani]|uniref:Uncharacterized protein n=1 Tax=Babesia duncani TaxID=323732 RepID=A0AAD9PL52_9APIC|nr:hypothetical protein BdWA1_001621 [Babesia duncani]